MLPRHSRLRDSTSFRDTVREGRSAGGRLVVVHRLDGDGTDAGRARVGLVVSRAVGGAVQRNRVKRRLRHLAHDRLDRLPAGASVVLRARPGAAAASFAELERAVDRGLDRASVGDAGPQR